MVLAEAKVGQSDKLAGLGSLSKSLVFGENGVDSNLGHILPLVISQVHPDFLSTVLGVLQSDPDPLL